MPWQVEDAIYNQLLIVIDRHEDVAVKGIAQYHQMSWFRYHQR